MQPSLTVFITTYKRQFLLERLIQLYSKSAGYFGVTTRLILIDATPNAFTLSIEQFRTEFFSWSYIHRPNLPFYKAMHVAAGQLAGDELSPVMFATDDEFGFPSKEALSQFKSSRFQLGVPRYVIAARQSDEVVLMWTGWTQLRDLAKFSSTESKIRKDLARSFADQGIVSFYHLYSTSYFKAIAQYANDVVTDILSSDPSAERACETLWSLSNVFCSQIYLPSSIYFRRVERRQSWNTIHTARYQKPIYPWVLFPRLKAETPDLFLRIIKASASFWTQVLGETVTEKEAEHFIGLHAKGYQLANSRWWREGYEYMLHRSALELTKPQLVASGLHKDHVFVRIGDKLNFSTVQRVQFRADWVCDPHAQALFQIIRADYFFTDEDRDLSK